MAGENREELRTGFDSAGIVKSCNELACKQESGLVAPMSLSSSRCLLSILCSRLLSISATTGFTNLHETDVGPAL